MEPEKQAVEISQWRDQMRQWSLLQLPNEKRHSRKLGANK
jgi:hypothetical protein